MTIKRESVKPLTAGAAFNAELHLMPVRHVTQIAAEQAPLRTVSMRNIVQVQMT